MSDDAAFHTTRWTRVAQSKGSSEEAQRALADLCETYYEPVHAFLRATVRNGEDAQEMTQAFFAQVLGQHAFDGANPERGRFRSFLLGAVKHFLWDQRRSHRAIKRGSGETPLSLDAGTTTSPGWTPPDNAQLSPDAEFDRRWALAVLAKALAEIRRESEAKNQKATFETLKPWLTGDVAGMRQAEAANQLGLSEGAVKVAIHRLRQRFREAVKAEISQTLVDSEQVTEELAHLEAALRRP